MASLGGKTRKAPAQRREQIADGALSVLATEGSRGLTHRAVDEAAGIPPGSTSNHFSTRSALLEAAARRHAELDMPPGAGAGALDAALTRDQARELLLAALDPVLDPHARPLLAARYELILEATRRPDLHEVMDESRRRFVALAEQLLHAGGCQTPAPHAAQLIALLDGLALDQLQDTATTLTRPGIEEALDRFLITC
jgi:DNA-binding transcriptional regulator YbjK